MASLVHIVYNSNSIMKCITVEGHAGIKKSGEGYEVCIALSALTQAMYRALLTIVGKRFLSYRIKDGFLNLELIFCFPSLFKCDSLGLQILFE